MRNTTATYASSVSTNLSTYEDLPGHHLVSIRNLIASSPDDSYPDMADDINLFMDNLTALEWDYSGVRDLDAFRSFQLAATYCLTCSEDSNDGDYDPTRECFMVELADGVVDEAPSDGGNNEEPHQQTKQWCRSQHRLLRQARWRDRHSWRNSKSSRPGSMRSVGDPTSAYRAQAGTHRAWYVPT